MFEYDNEYVDNIADIADIVTELNGGRVLPLIEETVDYNLDAEVSL